MALRLMKLGNTLIKQVTSPPSTRLSTRMERRFSKQASHVPIKDQEKEAAREGVFPIWVYGVIMAGYLLCLRQIYTEIDLETIRKENLKAMDQKIENLIREQDKLTQKRDDLQSEMVKLYSKKHGSTEPKRSDIGLEN